MNQQSSTQETRELFYLEYIYGSEELKVYAKDIDHAKEQCRLLRPDFDEQFTGQVVHYGIRVEGYSDWTFEQWDNAYKEAVRSSLNRNPKNTSA